MCREKSCLNGKKVPFGPGLLFQASSMEELIVSAEICEDVWSPIPPSIRAAMEGATVIVNCSASDETIGKDSYRRDLIKGQSARLIAGYIYANAGEGESTTDLVFGGHNLIAENGSILAESKRFENQIIYTELDIKRIVGERRKNTTFTMEKEKVLPRISFPLDVCETKLDKRVSEKDRYVPQDEKERSSAMRRDFDNPGNGAQKTSAPYPRKHGGSWYFGGIGFHIGIDCDSKSV